MEVVLEQSAGADVPEAMEGNLLQTGLSDCFP